MPDDPHGAFYYVEVDIQRIARIKYGDDFAALMMGHYEPLDPVIRLAEEKSIVAMPGGGFDAPQWSLRLSLANLNAEDYSKIARAGFELLDEYYSVYRASMNP